MARVFDILQIGELKKFVRNNWLTKNLYAHLHLVKTAAIMRKVVKELKEMETLTESEVFKRQQNRLQEMLDYAYKNTSFYRELFDRHVVVSDQGYKLTNIPLLTKDIIRENLPAMIAKGYKIEHLAKRSTGGSTGQPLEFYCDGRAGLLDMGHHAYQYSLMGHKKGDLVVSCGGFTMAEELVQNKIFWIKSHKGNLFGDYMFSVLYFNDDTIPIYTQRIMELRPAILRGYPSFFDRLASYILDNDIKIDFKIKGINLTAEMCTVTQRKNIEKAFSAMVFFEYGHKEISLYCYTKDKSYVYESSPIYGYIEVLNDDGTETNIGEVGHIVTTGFNNRGMPFIRYRTGDLGEISYRNGGVVRFSKILGRSQDYLIDKDGKKVFLIASIYGSNLKAFKHFKRWQIRQTERGKASILIIKRPEFSPADEKEILDYFTFFKHIDFNIRYVDDIPTTKIGKHMFVVRDFG